MTGEPVNYESDPDGNIICMEEDDFDMEDSEWSWTESDTVMVFSVDGPLQSGGDSPNGTDALLAQVREGMEKREEREIADSSDCSCWSHEWQIYASG